MKGELGGLSDLNDIFGAIGVYSKIAINVVYCTMGFCLRYRNKKC